MEDSWGFGFEVFLDHDTVSFFLFHLVPEHGGVFVFISIFLFFFDFFVEGRLVANINSLVFDKRFFGSGLFEGHEGSLMVIDFLEGGFLFVFE